MPLQLKVHFPAPLRRSDHQALPRQVSQGGVNGICRADRCAVRLGEVRVVDRRAGLRADRRADRRANGPCSDSDGPRPSLAELRLQPEGLMLSLCL